jgi:hypothetical protein
MRRAFPVFSKCWCDVAMTDVKQIENFAASSVTSCKCFKLAEPRWRSLSNHPPVHVSAQRSAVGELHDKQAVRKGVRMNTRNIQTFLMVSAAFFAMSAPVRSGSARTLANAVVHTAQVAPMSLASERITLSSKSDEDEQAS